MFSVISPSWTVVAHPGLPVSLIQVLAARRSIPLTGEVLTFPTQFCTRVSVFPKTGGHGRAALSRPKDPGRVYWKRLRLECVLNPRRWNVRQRPASGPETLLGENICVGLWG